MSLKDCHGLAGRLHIELRDPRGTLVERRTVNNLITTSGRRLLASMFAGAAQGPGLQIAVGGSGGEVLPGDTQLGSQVDVAAATIPAIGEDTVDGAPRVVLRVVATLPPTGKPDAQALQEAGILVTVSGAEPVLYNRVTFPLINRAGNLEMTLTWEVIF